MQDEEAARKRGLNAGMFRAFRNRNYRLYFAGQSVSQIGTWMQRTGISWVIYSITHSTFMLGASVFASQFPSFLFSLYGGIISDRFDRYKIVLITQTVSMVQAALLAALVLLGHYQVWEILSLSVILGICNAFDLPARMPMVHEMINNKADLPNAIALNSSMNNLARLIGPVLSGLILQQFGAGCCFLLNALSFVAVLSSLLLLKLPAYTPAPVQKKIRRELTEGFSYLRETPSISMVLLLLALVSFLVLPYNTLFPVFAKVIFKGNAATFGFINGFIGLGAVCGAYFLAALKPGTNLKSMLLINLIILGIGLILFSRISYLPLALLVAIFCGFGTMSQTSICNTIVQVESDKNMRGRVISYLAMAVWGMLPLGSLLVGAVSKKIGSANSVLCQGILALLIALCFSGFLRKVREKRIVVEQEELGV